MNPVLSAALGSILRWALALGAGWLVEHNVWTSSEATTYVAAGSLGILSLGLSLWSKYNGRIKMLTALTMPAGTSEADLKAHIAVGLPTPSISTPVDQPPAA